MSKSGRVLKNIFSNWAGIAVGLVLGFIQAPIVVLGLGNAWFGIWVLVNQITSYTWLFDLGIREAVIRYVSKHHAKKEFHEINKIVSTAIYLYLIISIMTIAIVTILVIILPNIFKLDQDLVGTARLVLFVVGLNIAINWYFTAYIGILMGLQRFDIFQNIGICTGVVNFILVITFIKAGHGIITLSLIGLSVSMVSNALIYQQCKKLLPEFKLLHFDWKAMQFRALINYSKYVFLNNIGSKLIYGADIVIIGIFLPVTAITFYAIPGSLINYMRNIVGSATWVLNPLVSQLESKNEMTKIKAVLENGTKFSLLVALPIGLVFLLMGKHFITLWMGREYGEGSALVLTVLTVGTLTGLAHNIMNSVLLGMSRHNIIAYVRIAEAIACTIMSVVFVRIWGITGVAFGMAIPHIVFMGILLPVFVCRSFAIPIGRYVKTSIIKPILSSIPFAVCCYCMQYFFPASNLAVFFFWITMMMPVYIISAWFITLSKTERDEHTQRIFLHIPCLRGFCRQRIP